MVEYIQTSIEILMNLKSEEALMRAERDAKNKASKTNNSLIPDVDDSDVPTFIEGFT
jgi:hypothetical protein